MFVMQSFTDLVGRNFAANGDNFWLVGLAR